MDFRSLRLQRRRRGGQIALPSVEEAIEAANKAVDIVQAYDQVECDSKRDAQLWHGPSLSECLTERHRQSMEALLKAGAVVLTAAKAYSAEVDVLEKPVNALQQVAEIPSRSPSPDLELAPWNLVKRPLTSEGTRTLGQEKLKRTGTEDDDVDPRTVKRIRRPTPEIILDPLHSILVGLHVNFLHQANIYLPLALHSTRNQPPHLPFHPAAHGQGLDHRC